MKRMLIAFTLACVLSGTALAGEVPGVPGSVVGDVPGVPSTSTGETNTPPVPGDMPGVESGYSGTDESLVTTVLLTFITTLLGR